jgi:hypothetical protein
MAAAQGVSQLLTNLPKHKAAPHALAIWTKERTVLRVTSRTSTSKTYIATHTRTEPPPDQMITTEKQNIILRQFSMRKRSAVDEEVPTKKRKLDS